MMYSNWAAVFQVLERYLSSNWKVGVSILDPFSLHVEVVLNKTLNLKLVLMLRYQCVRAYVDGCAS